MADRIFEYEWTDIQRAQQGGRLSRAIDTSKPPMADAPTDADLAMLAEHGEAGLRERGFWGVIDRLTRAGIITA